ncbi:CshA/CshB family fibrillar adhesin-related protein [Chitinophaga sedimenti]|uniref:CshA/CshB family fibrillar adhesin-related protein n=1 Tax=Chitinophaga sedimenti TaxID=2033606 RepID=UPI00249F3402|nr:CshA/CshB family fibrillar adhesin-related protein [Chitinophaga sedimenti]
MRKRLLTILLLLCNIVALGQYADKGNGTLREQIWWLDWSDFPITASHSMTTTDGLVLTFTASNVTGAVPVTSVMKTWGAAMLYSLYDFNSPNLKPALYSVGNNENTTFRLTVQATRNGQPAAFTLITADAEASAPNEVTTITTSGDAGRRSIFSEIRARQVTLRRAVEQKP